MLMAKIFGGAAAVWVVAGLWLLNPNPALTLLLGVLALGALYFLPSGVALARQHHNRGAVIVVNVFLGWSLIGWVVALAMASGEVRERSA